MNEHFWGLKRRKGLTNLPISRSPFAGLSLPWTTFLTDENSTAIDRQYHNQM